MDNKETKTQAEQTVPAFKVGDRVVFSYLQDIEPAVIRKIQGEQATIDIGTDKLYTENLGKLIRVEDTTDFQFVQPETSTNVISQAIEQLDVKAKVREQLHKVMASIPFEKEYKTVANELGDPTEELTFEHTSVGTPVRRIGAQKIGKIISYNSSTNHYRVKWSEDLITTNWAQELARVK